MGRIGVLLTCGFGWLTLLSVGAAAAEVQVVVPHRVVDLHQIVQKTYGRSDFSSAGIAQYGDRWVALLDSGAKDAVVVKGDWNSEEATLRCGAFDAVELDAEYRIHLRHRLGLLVKKTRVTIADWDTDEFSIREIPFDYAQPFRAGKHVAWKGRLGRTGFFADAPAGRLHWTQSAEDPTQPATPGSTPESEYVLGLPDGGYIVLGWRTEVIRVFSPDGDLRSAAVADLDAAYALVGKSYPKPDPASGILRMVWANSSPEGLLCVGLSGMRLADGVPIAIIRPEDGRVVKVIHTVLPGTKWRRDRYNPIGAIFPNRGAVGEDRFLLLDRSLDIVALYFR